jgi:LPS-assembly protein
MLPVSRLVPALSSCRAASRRRLRADGSAIRALGTALASCLALIAASPAAADVLAAPGWATTAVSRLGLGDQIATGAGLLPALPTSAPATNLPSQDASPRQAGPAQDAGPVSFEADKAEYDDQTEILTARGNVFLKRQDQSVKADAVTWNRKTGKIIATGNIRMVDKDGNVLFTSRMELTDQFDIGAMQGMLLALREGGRLAAENGQRDASGRIVLTHAAYTGCDVVDTKGCDIKPSWKIDSRLVTYDPRAKILRFTGARLILFGLKLPPFPAPVIIATDGRAVGGLLIPNVRVSAANGVEFSDAYYRRLGDNKDLTATAYVYSKVAPMAELQYRALTGAGAYQISGFVTSSSRIPVSGNTAAAAQTELRGYVDANGQFQLSPAWDFAFSGRLASDRTFLRRYSISSDDELRSTAKLEHIDANSYFSLTGWAFQTLRTGESQGLVPVALPEIDYRRRIADPLLGGIIQLQANSLAITRTSGEDTQRAFASARWDLHRITPLGQQVTLTALVRGDVYHSSHNALTAPAVYQGLPGWQGRATATAAVDMVWPFVGALLGGTQVLSPHVQLVVTPPTRNLAIPNEDSRTIELAEGNLFALNRFPGYDRIEDGAHVTYGVDWQLERPGLRANATIGQSYRLTSHITQFPDGTGLANRLSDVVGRVEVRYRDFFKLTERFRIDKSTLALHRNEIDATLGSERTYLEVGYLRLNRQTATSLEDLADSNELRAAARIGVGRHWSGFASGVFDLSRSNLQLVNNITGLIAAAPPGNAPISPFQPLRTRFGVSYQSDCLELDFTFRRDYITIGDATKGNSFMLHLSLKNLGVR